MTNDNHVQVPATIPSGKRSLLVRDTGGNLVNIFTRVTAGPIQRLGG